MARFNSSPGGFNRDSRRNDRFGGKSNSRDRFNRGGGKSRMHEATCSSCGKRCQVPFRPTGSKPVLCNACFNNGNSNSFAAPNQNARESSDLTQQFAQVNAKLDLILQALEELEIIADEDESEDDEDIE